MLEITPERAYNEEYKKLKNSTASGSFKSRFSIPSNNFHASGDSTVLGKLEEMRRFLLSKSNTIPATGQGSLSRTTKNNTDEQSKIIASMLPDEVIYHTGDYTPRSFETAIFLADISGFTNLSDKYQKVPNGASRLSQVLNFYMGTMVQEILSHGGDVIKFGGDAFIATFKVDAGTSMQQAIHKSLDTAIVIQKNCRNYKTDIGIHLNVKIAIAVGSVYFSLVGNEKSSHYIILGDPIWRVKKLEKQAKPGDILMTFKSWYYTQANLYSCEIDDNLKCVKVFGFKNSLGFVQRQHEAMFDFYEMQKNFEIATVKTTIHASVTFLEPSDPNSSFDDIKKQNFAIRKSFYTIMGDEMKTFLRSFMIPPLLNVLDNEDPLENLTEMRKIVIVFANFELPTATDLNIIETVNSIYEPLYDIVENHEGTLNKLSLFDKDMMFLIVFGLRGFRHDVESQVALRCAAEIVDTFKTQENLQSVSIGVTTGICYCGIVGHSLRKEYSVISLTVNKAARMMINYPNIVSCDQETFMDSRMDTRNFKIMPKKKMKGFSEDILVYQYEEIDSEQENQDPREIPLLGRNGILNLYRKITSKAYAQYRREEHYFDDPNYSCVLIKGGSRQGKTRILHEIRYEISLKGWNFQMLKLVPNFSMKPYSTFALILKRVLGIPLNLSTADLRSQLDSKFKDFHEDDQWNVLKTIFNLNTKPSTISISSSINSESYSYCDYQNDFVKDLCRSIFKGFWVILLDDLEFVDYESLRLFEILFELDNIFCIFAIGKRKKVTKKQKALLRHYLVYQYSLDPIGVLYHKPLACRYLKVFGISLELERFIHLKSNGNPGWIISCLTSLQQSNKLKIQEMSISDAIQAGVTFAEKQYMENAEGFENIRCVDEWDMYKASFRDDFNCLKRIVQNTVAGIDDYDGLVKVAVLDGPIEKAVYATDLKLEDDMMLFDTLSSYEHSVCKCASVLGLHFTRDMFVYVFCDNELVIAKTLAKLFELKIFTCASQSYESEMRSRATSELIVCCCKIKIKDVCRDLPKYASCTFIKFQKVAYQKAIYGLLTENQRIEYHKRCLKYLYQKTNKCEACKGGPFEKLVADDFDFEYNIGYRNSLDISMHVDFFKQIQMEKPSRRLKALKDLCCFIKPACPRKSHVLCYMINDFRHCECNMILYNMYSKVNDHCKGADFQIKLIESKIELANVCIKLNNIPRALILLKKSLVRLENSSLNDDSKYLTFLRGRAYTFLGICYSSISQPNNATNSFYKVCETFQIDFPQTFNLFANIKLWQLQSEVKSLANPAKLKDDEDVPQIHYLITHQIQECLSQMYQLFFELKQYDLAKLAAYWSLQKALRYKKRNFTALADSFANVFKIVYLMGPLSNCSWMQKIALQLVNCAMCKDGIDKDGLSAVLRLYNGMILCQSAHSDTDTAIQLGYISISISEGLNNLKYQTKMVPFLITMLQSQRRLREAASLLQDFNFTMYKIRDKIGICWYYALCMDILLDTSYTILTYEQCEKFHLHEYDTINNLRDMDASSRFYVNMWLWCVRNEYFESAQCWMKKVESCFSFNMYDSVNHILTAIRLLEGLCLILVNSMNSRFLLLEAYLDNILSLNFGNEKKLKKLEKTALKRKNCFINEVICHTILVWNREIPRCLESFWNDHSKAVKYRSIDEIIDKGENIIPYSLQLPKIGRI